MSIWPLFIQQLVSIVMVRKGLWASCKKKYGVQHTFDEFSGQELLQIVPVVDVLAPGVLDLANTHNRLSGLVSRLSYKKSAGE